MGREILDWAALKLNQPNVRLPKHRTTNDNDYHL